MNEDDRRRFESIFQLYDLSNKQFNERRNYEFKVSIGVWTVLIAAIAGSISLAGLTSVPKGNFLLLCAAIIVILLHILWIYGLFKSAHRDRLRGISYETQLKGMASVNFDQETEDYIKEVNKNRFVKYWAVVFNISTTILLALTLVLLNWNKLESGSSVRESEKAKINLENQKITLENQKLELEIEQLRKGIQSGTQLEKPNKSDKIQRRR